MSYEIEGVIKFDQSDFTPISGIPVHEYRVLERYRQLMNELELISAYEDGFGFGNISKIVDYSNIYRSDKPQFLISGSQTGHLKNLTGEHYTRILDFDIEQFFVKTQGAIKASSETLTHAAIYDQNPAIKAIIHFHNIGIWKALIKSNCPATSRWIEYGTFEMAVATMQHIGSKTQGYFVMRGHREGVVVYGPSLNAVFNQVIRMVQDHSGRNDLLRKLL